MATLPDFLPDLRAWLRTNASMGPLVQGRVFFRIPAKDPASPFMRIYRSGGGVQPNAEVPFSTIRVAIETWVTTPSLYQTLRGLQIALETAIQNFVDGRRIGPGQSRVLNAVLTTAADMVDPDTGWPRIVSDTVWTVSV
jgi:hypothetical protein